jgi:hypothetical protein
VFVAESPIEANLQEVWDGLRLLGVSRIPQPRYASPTTWRDELENQGLTVELLETRTTPVTASRELMVPYLSILLDPVLTAIGVEKKWSLVSRLCDLLEDQVVYRRLLVAARTTSEPSGS